MNTLIPPRTAGQAVPRRVEILFRNFTKGKRLSKSDPFQSNELDHYRRFRAKLARIIGPNASPDRRNLALFDHLLGRFRLARGL